MQPKETAVFLDRDGTINEEVEYLDDWNKFKLIPGALPAIKLLNESCFKTVVVTNQSGVARGYFPETLVHTIHNKMENLFRDQNVQIDGIYYCPHHAKAGIGEYKKKCTCRKPETGMLDKASQDLNIDLSRSYVVGDKMSDVEMGKKIYGKGILVLTGHGLSEIKNRITWKNEPDYIAKDLLAAVKWILNDIN